MFDFLGRNYVLVEQGLSSVEEDYGGVDLDSELGDDALGVLSVHFPHVDMLVGDCQLLGDVSEFGEHVLTGAAPLHVHHHH